MNKIIIPLLLSIFFLTAFSINENGSQRAYYECSKPMDIDTSLFKVRHGEVYFHFDVKKEPGNLKAKGFHWLEDNPNNFFTAYFINTSDSSFSTPKQDGSLIMIQEALNEQNTWLPIEHWVYSGCGNSYDYPLKLDSGKYVMIPIKKYSGTFKTKMRLKLKTNYTIFYSETFEGSMEKSMFKKETKPVDGILYHGAASYLDDEK